MSANRQTSDGSEVEASVEMDQVVRGRTRKQWLAEIQEIVPTSRQHAMDIERAHGKLLEPNGGFGVCANSGDVPHNIASKRLRLNPVTPLCIRCQKETERDVTPVARTSARRRTR